MTKNSFTGPIFIVGLPRSGTKLLRDLLNQNPTIGIPIAETHFIPLMVKRFGNPPRLQETDAFDDFYDRFSKTRFFWYMKGFGKVLERDQLERSADVSSWQALLEYILKFYAPSGRAPDFIWGDKCPSYLERMPFLKDVFPDARFIHIIRDPRDCCMSMKKAWGRSLYSSAQYWQRALAGARPEGKRLGDDYMEISFESLLENPKGPLTSICDFLGCNFVPQMMYLGRPTEDLGHAQGETAIIKNNAKKYDSRLSTREIKRIEEIVYPVLTTAPYDPDYATRFRPLGRLSSRLCQIHNRFNRLRFDIRTKGFLEGLKFYLSK